MLMVLVILIYYLSKTKDKKAYFIIAGIVASIMSLDFEYNYKLVEDFKLLITTVVVPSIVFLLKLLLDSLRYKVCDGTGCMPSIEIEPRKKKKKKQK